MLKKAWSWIDDRIGISDVFMPLLKHVVPRDARWWYVFGSATLCAFIIQVFTGICLAMAYVPGGEDAYRSLQYITNEAPLGNLLRGMHSYGASAMVALAVIHMTQVFLHATYKYPREMNWMSGVVLLFVVLGMAFTGQLLRWDDNGVWTVVVAAEMAGRAPVVGPSISHFILGGETVGGATLSRFFVFHVFVMPGIIFAGIGLHLYLIFRHGISEMPKAGQKVDPKTYKKEYEARLKKTGEPFWPNAMWRDVVFSSGLVIVIVVLAAVFGGPALSTPPDPGDIHANPMPDWYFWWYFTILSLSPPSLETWIILGAPVLGFLLLLVVPLFSNKGERAPSRRPWAVGIVIAGFVGWVVLTIYGYHKPWSPDFDVPPLPEKVVGASEGPVARGGELVHQKGCLYCHNIDGYGGHRGPELTEIGDRLTRDDIIIRINNGGHNMPSFAGAVTSEELSDLVDFLLTRKGGTED
jgi:ubiquinol-cytochrome c reductase cytochrome b subunit